MKDADSNLNWAVFVRDFRERHGLTQKVMAEKCGLSVFTLRRIEAGDMPNGPAAATIRKYVESVPVEDVSIPRQVSVDEVSVVLVARTIKHHKEINRLEGLQKNVISKDADDFPEDLEAQATKALLNYIAKITDIEKRHTRLFELMEVGSYGK